MMPTIHPTAVIDGDVSLAETAVIGPYCVLDGTTGPITIGSGTRLMSMVNLTGPLIIGQRNTIYPNVCLGFPAQDLKWDPARPGAGIVIGHDNTFREGATVHRATSDESPTTIGHDNYLMGIAHIGHDARVGNNTVISQAAMLGGFVDVADRVTIGGAAGVHQHCRIGRGCMLGGNLVLLQDLPPFFMLTGSNVAGSLNLIGLRRSHTPAAVIEEIRWVFRTLYRSGLSMKSALRALRDHEPTPTIDEYIDFIERSQRGICQGRAKRIRAAAG